MLNQTSNHSSESSSFTTHFKTQTQLPYFTTLNYNPIQNLQTISQLKCPFHNQVILLICKSQNCRFRRLLCNLCINTEINHLRLHKGILTVNEFWSWLLDQNQYSGDDLNLDGKEILEQEQSTMIKWIQEDVKSLQQEIVIQYSKDVQIYERIIREQEIVVESIEKQLRRVESELRNQKKKINEEVIYRQGEEEKQLGGMQIMRKKLKQGRRQEFIQKYYKQRLKKSLNYVSSYKTKIKQIHQITSIPSIQKNTYKLFYQIFNLIKYIIQIYYYKSKSFHIHLDLSSKSQLQTFLKYYYQIYSNTTLIFQFPSQIHFTQLQSKITNLSLLKSIQIHLKNSQFTNILLLPNKSKSLEIYIYDIQPTLKSLENLAQQFQNKKLLYGVSNIEKLKLNFRKNGLNDEKMKVICKIIYKTYNLDDLELDLSENRLSQIGIQYLSHAISSLNNLKVISIRLDGIGQQRNNIGNSGLKYFLIYLDKIKMNLQRLILGLCLTNINNKCIQWICQFMENCNLNELVMDLRENEIQLVYLRRLCQSVGKSYLSRFGLRINLKQRQNKDRCIQLIEILKKSNLDEIMLCDEVNLRKNEYGQWQNKYKIIE